MKTCSRCSESKELEDFGPRSASADGRQPWCRDCSRVYARTKERERTLKKFNLTQEQYDAMVEEQDDRCAICGRSETTKSWAIDHNHSCCPGQSSCGECIRGLLCLNCNTALGLFGDNVDSLRSAISYLTKPK